MRGESLWARWHRLNPDQRALLVRSWLVVVSVRAGLWALPFVTLRRILQRASQRAVGTTDAARVPSAARIAWAIAASSRAVPRGRSCLPRALAGEYLLRRHGYPAELRLGVAPDRERQLEAHAWVDCGGRAVIGATGLDRYRPLISPAAERISARARAGTLRGGRT